MPGYQSFEAVDELHSKWVLKVALGALTRTVPLEVTITDRRKPDHISFTLRGESDPVDGQGAFTASATGARQTSVVVTLAISGNGPMAATMEAMSRPVVPRMTRVLSEALKTAIESSAVAPDQSWLQSTGGHEFPYASEVWEDPPAGCGHHRRRRPDAGASGPLAASLQTATTGRWLVGLRSTPSQTIGPSFAGGLPWDEGPRAVPRWHRGRPPRSGNRLRRPWGSGLRQADRDVGGRPACGRGGLDRRAGA